MQVIEGYKYVGIIASFTAWLAIAVVLYGWPVVKSKSISKHVSASRQSWLLFAPIETIALILLYLFMISWLIPILELSNVFLVLVTIALLLELITTWVPDTSGIKHKIHHYTAYTAALLVPVVTLFIAASALTPTIAKVIAYICTLIALGIVGLFLFAKNTREKHLIYQSIYFACFHISMLAVIFTAK